MCRSALPARGDSVNVRGARSVRGVACATSADLRYKSTGDDTSPLERSELRSVPCLQLLDVSVHNRRRDGVGEEVATITAIPSSRTVAIGTNAPTSSSTGSRRGSSR